MLESLSCAQESAANQVANEGEDQVRGQVQGQGESQGKGENEVQARGKAQAQGEIQSEVRGQGALSNEDAVWKASDALLRGQVVKLDRGFPLVELEDGLQVRCEHATTIIKGEKVRAVIGDFVQVSHADDHDKAIIESIEPRRCELVRKDPTERAQAQVLAANFDRVMVVHPLAELNRRRLERELVLAHETGAEVTVLLTKADLAESPESIKAVRDQVHALAGDNVETLIVSSLDSESIEAVRDLIPENTMCVLIGRSGVGKSSLVNLLVGHEVQQTQAVREIDGKGRHTTVNREIIQLPQGGRIVDMPGVRGLGMWEADEGIGAAFVDVEELAVQCRFRDCKHGDEPGCAVRAAVESGTLATERWESYLALKAETAAVRRRCEEARWHQGEKGSPGKRGAQGKRPAKGKRTSSSKRSDKKR